MEAWRRLRRDKVALAGAFFLVFLVLVAIFAPVIVHFLGDPPNQFNQDLITEFRTNKGVVTGVFANRPLLLLTTIGAKSGQPRTTNSCDATTPESAITAPGARSIPPEMMTIAAPTAAMP